MVKVKTTRRWKGIQYPIIKPQDERYNPRPPSRCIYGIRCLVTNKIYVGSSPMVGQRIIAHRKQLKGNRHHNKQLQLEWNQYGGEMFVFEVLEAVFDDEADLYSIEQEWIDKLRLACEVYNAMNSRSKLKMIPRAQPKR